MNPKAPLCFNYPWERLQDSLYPSVIREYLDWGIDTFVITEALIGACLENPARIGFLKGLKKEFHIHFAGTHAPSGRCHDLNVPDMECRPKLFREHVRAMEISADFGSRTYTMHVGAYHYCLLHVPMETLRPLSAEMLEKLVPEAERIGIAIAVENSFEMPNSAKEVLALVEPFSGSPAVGVCYDTGHANIMEAAPGKDPAKYEDYMRRDWWEAGVVPEQNAIDLLQPHVVTTHIHDNNGYGDQHGMPFDGSIDFNALMPKLFGCPRMLEYQTEICFQHGSNWAGRLLAPSGGYSIKRQVEAFRRLGFR